MSDTTTIVDTATNTINAISANSDTFSEAVQKFASFMQHLAEKYGSTIVDTVLWVARIEALSIIVYSIAAGIISYLLFRLARKAYNNFTYTKADRYIPVMMISGAGSFLTFCYSVTNLLDVWLWVMLFNPQLGIAGKVMTKFLH